MINFEEESEAIPAPLFLYLIAQKLLVSDQSIIISNDQGPASLAPFPLGCHPAENGLFIRSPKQPYGLPDDQFCTTSQIDLKRSAERRAIIAHSKHDAILTATRRVAIGIFLKKQYCVAKIGYSQIWLRRNDVTASIQGRRDC